MKKFLLVAAALGFSASHAIADGYDPFPFQAAAFYAGPGLAVVDTGSEAYPQFTGTGTAASSLATLLPSSGSEGVLQTANSLPRDLQTPAVVTAKTPPVQRTVASAAAPRQLATAGAIRPRN